MEQIKITVDDLLDILREFAEDEYESKPLDALGFCQYIFNKYKDKSK